MSLKETLENLKRTDDYRSGSDFDRDSIIKEWQTAIEKLYKDIQDYLTEYESLGLVFETEEIEVAEDGLGCYFAPVLNINAPGAVVVVRPLGRMTVGGSGRADIRRLGRSFAEERGSLIRLSDEASDSSSWVISSPPAPSEHGRLIRLGSFRYTTLNKSSIEGAVDFLLQ